MPIAFEERKDSLLHVDKRWYDSAWHERFTELIPTSVWNYGLVKKDTEIPSESVKVVKGTIRKDFVWNEENAPIHIFVFARQIPAWQLDDNHVANIPVTTRDGTYMGEVEKKQERLKLIPYGCTKLRIVAFPVVP